MEAQDCGSIWSCLRVLVYCNLRADKGIFDAFSYEYHTRPEGWVARREREEHSMRTSMFETGTRSWVRDGCRALDCNTTYNSTSKCCFLTAERLDRGRGTMSE